MKEGLKKTAIGVLALFAVAAAAAPILGTAIADHSLLPSTTVSDTVCKGDDICLMGLGGGF